MNRTHPSRTSFLSTVLIVAALALPLPHTAYSRDALHNAASAQERSARLTEDDAEFSSAALDHDDAVEAELFGGEPVLTAEASADSAAAAKTGSSSAAQGGSGGAARGDFNGDGIGDLAIGVPLESVTNAAGQTVPSAGAVHILYGGHGGLSAAGTLFLTQELVGGSSEPGDVFGLVLAAGDFNDDNFSDLAVSAPGEALETVPGASVYGAGALTIVFGSPFGITVGRQQLFDQRGVGEIPEDGDRFGGALASADFNGDGVDDLAVGAPDEDLTSSGENLRDAGAVFLLHGTAGGLVSRNTLTQDTPGALGIANTGDRFGATLAAGDFNADAFADLIVGAPGESLFARGDGAVHVFIGTGSIVSTANNQIWHQGRRDAFENRLAGSAEADDHFGAVLAVGDFNGDLVSDLAVGVPDENIDSIADAGVVHVLFGVRGTGLTAQGDQLWDQNTGSVFNTVEAGDHFGAALAAGDFDGNQLSDLAIGVPDEDVDLSRGTVRDGGIVHVLYATGSGLGTASQQLWHQERAAGTVTAGDRFGASLTAWNFGGTFQTDLAIGVPSENVGAVEDAGAVNVVYGSSTRLKSSSVQVWHQNSAGIPDQAEPFEFLGGALN